MARWLGGGLLRDVHDAFHEQPVAWEGANVRIVASVCGGGELDGFGLVGLHELGVGYDVRLGGFRDVAFGHALGIGEHGVGKGADSVEFAGLEEEEVVWLGGDAAGVVERELDLLTRFDAEFGLVIAERVFGIGLELQGHAGVLGDSGDGEGGECGEQAELLHG